MTRHGHINGQKGRRGNQHKPTPAPGTEAMDAARADAVTYLERTGNSDLLPILGLVADPVAERARRAKALVDMGSKPWSQRAAGPGDCERCGNALPKSGVCRKTMRCRAAAAKEEARHRD